MSLKIGRSKSLRTLFIFIALILALVAWVLLSGGTETFANKYANADLTTEVAGIGRANTYVQYLQLHAEAPLDVPVVEVDVLQFATEDAAAVYADAIDGKTVLYTADGSLAEWTVHVPVSGMYRVKIDYYATASRGVDIERSLYINGQLPFAGAENMTFTRIWSDAGEVKQDNRGNDIRPSQTEVFAWQRAYCRDYMGYHAEPYLFYLQQGENVIGLKALNEPMLIGAITLEPVTQTMNYAQYAAQHAGVSTTALGRTYNQKIQGESAVLRSSPSLYARYDHSSPGTEPYSVTTTVLNYIGGNAWNKAGQWIEWDFSVPEDGYYYITVKARQIFSRGTLSCRAVYIDGQIPFAEMESVSFKYSSDWEYVTLGDEQGNAYRFFLTAGAHTLRLEATTGEMGSILEQMEDSIYRLNQIYRKILVLTGVTPDQYRDYRLQAVYPDVIEAMHMESMRLYKLVDDTVAVTGQKGDRIAVAQTLAVQLEAFVKNPDRITKSFVNFKDNITGLGTAMQNMSETKLDVDLIIISGVDARTDAGGTSALARLVHEVSACVASYTVDYNSLGDVYDGTEGDTIEVWIMTGRDQSSILKTMVDDTFTPQSGIRVNVKLVEPNALLSAVVAGNGPDVVVSTDSWNPVNYALRNAVVDLTQFDGFDEVISDFYPSAYTALQLNGGVYALPETQVCSVLFYREDVLNDLGLSVPDTWDDLIAILPTLQGNSMSIGIPFPDSVNPNLFTLYSMIYQNDGAIYNENASRTVIDSEAGVASFKLYTSLYTDYGLPTIFDFVSRFRSGEMPLGIYDYTTYNTLTVSAPEIRGLWNFTVLPGVEKTDENGKTYIDRSVHSQGASCMMIATDDETIKQNAWEFMKWWVSAESQVRFGREIESVLGSSARYATANKYAFDQLAWSSEQVKVIRAQMEQAVGFREVAGGYYTNRHLTNAIRKVVTKKTDPRETLLDYARIINEELAQKRAEFDWAID